MIQYQKHLVALWLKTIISSANLPKTANATSIFFHVSAWHMKSLSDIVAWKFQKIEQFFRRIINIGWKLSQAFKSITFYKISFTDSVVWDTLNIQQKFFEIIKWLELHNLHIFWSTRLKYLKPCFLWWLHNRYNVCRKLLKVIFPKITSYSA